MDSVSRVNDEIKGLKNVVPCTCVKLHIQSGFLLHMLSIVMVTGSMLQCSCSIIKIQIIDDLYTTPHLRTIVADDIDRSLGRIHCDRWEEDIVDSQTSDKLFHIFYVAVVSN